MGRLEVDLGFIKLKNPVIPASGTFGYGSEFKDFLDLDELGAFVLKGIYRNRREGNDPPRIFETPSGLLNSIGLAGPGADELKDKIRVITSQTSTPIIVNVCGESDDEYLEVAKIFDRMNEVPLLELNISCPNIREGGKCPAQSEEHTFSLVKMIKDEVSTPLIVKLSPNVSDISSIAIAAEEAGADSISLVNTFLGLAIDLKRRKPVFKNILAGLSGPAIKPLALRLVWDVCNAVSIPVIGIGGIMTGKDVLEYIFAGASAIQTGTVNMIEPGASIRIIREIDILLDELEISSLDEIRGRLEI